MEMTHYIPKIKELCMDNGISYLGVFGSQSRNDANKLSDVDLLVKFNQPIGYFGLVELEDKFREIFKKDVDLVTVNGVSKLIQPFVYKDLKTLYGEL